MGNAPAESSLRRVAAELKSLAIVVSDYHGLRQNILRGWTFDLARFVTPSVGVSKQGVVYHLPTADRTLSRDTFIFGDFEQDLLAAAVELLRTITNNGEPLAGRWFVDIGANIGTTIVPALAVFDAGRGIACEPAPDNLRFLRANIAANGLNERVLTFGVALSASSAENLLALSDYNWGDHRLGVSEQDDGARSSVSVPTVTFDELVARNSIDLDEVGLVWMDTQGSEGHILAGATTMLERRVPVVCEYWPFGLRRSGGLQLFHELVAKHYGQCVDLRAARKSGSPAPFPAGEVARLERSFTGTAYTDLFIY